jgi:hypothetical protein
MARKNFHETQNINFKGWLIYVIRHSITLLCVQYSVKGMLYRISECLSSRLNWVPPPPPRQCVSPPRTQM